MERGRGRPPMYVSRSAHPCAPRHKPIRGQKKAAVRGGIAAGVQTNRGFVWKCVKFSSTSYSLEMIYSYISIIFRYISMPPVAYFVYQFKEQA